MSANSDHNVGGVPPPRNGARTGEGTRPTPPPLDESTGLSGVRRWRTVYWIVFGIFVLWVSLLAWFTAAYK
jgi:hypothetical protein